MTLLSRLMLVFSLLGLVGCATTPPAKTQDICSIFSEKRSWYKQAKRAEKKWDSSVPIMMSIMFQESQFKHNARPPRKKILWVIPGPRASDAYGYPQAKNATWKEYQRSTGNGWARRDKFKDAIDFIGWYNKQSQIRSRISPTNARNLYLAYHEGHGGFNRGTYRNKGWLLRTAQNVDSRAEQYQRQLNNCESSFKRRWLFF